MKKLSILFLILILLFGCFSLSACQNQLEIDITSSAEVIPDVTEKIVEGDDSYQTKRYWVLKYYVDPAKYDLSTVNSIKIKTWMPTYKSGKLSTHQKTFTAIIPDDVAPTAENNYFIVELDKSKYNPTAEKEWSHQISDYLDNFTVDENGVKHFYYYQDFETVIGCYVYINDDGETESNPITGVTKIPSIGMTFLIGLVMVLVGFALYYVALILIQNKIAVAIVFAIPIILTIGSYFTWGVWRGVIMTVFFAIYYVGVAIFNKRLGENLY